MVTPAGRDRDVVKRRSDRGPAVLIWLRETGIDAAVQARGQSRHGVVARSLSRWYAVLEHTRPASTLNPDLIHRIHTQLVTDRDTHTHASEILWTTQELIGGTLVDALMIVDAIERAERLVELSIVGTLRDAYHVVGLMRDTNPDARQEP